MVEEHINVTLPLTRYTLFYRQHVNSTPKNMLPDIILPYSTYLGIYKCSTSFVLI